MFCCATSCCAGVRQGVSWHNPSGDWPKLIPDFKFHQNVMLAYSWTELGIHPSISNIRTIGQARKRSPDLLRPVYCCATSCYAGVRQGVAWHIPSGDWPKLIPDFKFLQKFRLADSWTELGIVNKFNIYIPKAAIESNYTYMKPLPCSGICVCIWNAHCEYLKFS